MKKVLLISLFLAAFLERTVFDLGPNYELVTTAMILAVHYTGKKEGFLLTLAIVAFTDRIIGNTSIFLFTWSGFLISALFASDVLKKFNKRKNKLQNPITSGSFDPATLTITAFSANILFFLWTNFGVWFLDSWGMYPDNVYGLLLSYINALPFLKNQLVSTLVFVPSGFLVIEGAQKMLSRLKYRFLMTPAEA
ncbi:MAG: hypothetical protein PVJ52_00865 [Candidatus Woesebacteria bacterium]|jgi:hypothetical protein